MNYKTIGAERRLPLSPATGGYRHGRTAGRIASAPGLSPAELQRLVADMVD